MRKSERKEKDKKQKFSNLIEQRSHQEKNQ